MISLDDLENLTAVDIELYLSYLSCYEFEDKEYSCNDQAKARKLSFDFTASSVGSAVIFNAPL